MSGLGRGVGRVWARAAWVVVFTLVLISSLASTSWAKPRFKTLHTFTRRGATRPFAGLVADLQGNLYGTTATGGALGWGSVFELASDGHGGWNETLLHSFKPKGGRFPEASLIFDADGDLYGTTTGGGIYGFGTVFELAPDGHGGWHETVLHSFNGTDGLYPAAGLIFDSGGSLYGTTQQGGASGAGTIFNLAPNGHDGWNETVLHSFDVNDGKNPLAGLVFDVAGNLYGTTVVGGASGLGTVFELVPDGHGTWKETVLHSFSGDPDGYSPEAGLIFDSSGNLYGTTMWGGASGAGTIFKLARNGHDGWNETVLHSCVYREGQNPVASLVFDAAGNLYGTTWGGGTQGFGTVFKLAPNGHGDWKQTVLHSFKNRPGALPLGSLIYNSLGRLYGTTRGDRRTTFGSVFEITP